MLGIVTTLSTQGTTAYQPCDSLVQHVKASTEYIINTDNIVRMKVYSTNDSTLYYKLNRFEDRSPEFILRVNETNAAIQTLADTAAASNMLLLDVFVNEYDEDVLSYTEAGLSTTSTVAKYFNIDDIVWIEENAAATMSMLLYCEGGKEVQKIFVDSNLGQIEDLYATGTTTTSTSSTSTTTQEEPQ
jgi:CTP:phosphocholine cytidylyltransferase-like protein